MERKTKKPKNYAEGKCYDELEKEGWRLTKKGQPDFFCEKDEEICVVEVKQHSFHLLKRDKHVIITALMECSIRCYKHSLDSGLVQWSELVEKETAEWKV